MEYLVGALLGLAVGLLALFWQRGRWLAEAARLAEQATGLAAQLEQERRGAEEKQALLRSAEKQLADAFNALSAEALARNNQAFLDLATQNLSIFQETAKGDLAARQQAVEGLVKPLSEELAKLAGQTQALEKARAESYGQISEQAVKLLSCDMACIVAWDEEQQRVELVSSYGMDETEVEAVRAQVGASGVLQGLTGQQQSIATLG